LIDDDRIVDVGAVELRYEHLNKGKILDGGKRQMEIQCADQDSFPPSL
jgi:hypothetical protein